MWNPKEDNNVQKAVYTYLHEHGLVLPETAKYEVIIDGVDIKIDNNVVLEVNLPPVSNYTIDETEHTRKYLKPKAESAAQKT